MNVKNNKRRKESQNKIEKAFVELLQSREIKETTRRCGKCPENVKYAARVRHREMQFLTLISIQEENGMLISRL
mgnify:CR=1 FL=1